MKHGNLVVIRIPFIESDYGIACSTTKEPWFAVCRMDEYTHGNRETVEDSYKVRLNPVGEYENVALSRAWYTDIFSVNHFTGKNSYKEFSPAEYDNAVLLANRMNNMLKMLYYAQENLQTLCITVDGDLQYFIPVDNKYKWTSKDDDGNAFNITLPDLVSVLFNLIGEHTINISC